MSGAGERDKREGWRLGTWQRVQWASFPFSHTPPGYMGDKLRGRSWGTREPVATVHLRAAAVGRGGWILGVLLTEEPTGLAGRASAHGG